ncbi:hypothetical protein EDD11_010550, partial [Mortierella claussenii]
MTIHKSQSLTLHKVVVNLRDVFASGQAYVALSRVRSRNDIFIEDWSSRGLLNVRHAIRTRLTKESENARVELDDLIDKHEEQEEAGSRAEFEGLAYHRGNFDVLKDGPAGGEVRGWEDIRNSVGDQAAQQEDSEVEVTDNEWDSDGRQSDLSSSSESDGDGEFDIESDEGNELDIESDGDNGGQSDSSEAITMNVGNSMASSTCQPKKRELRSISNSDSERLANSICQSKKRGPYSTLDSDSDGSTDSTDTTSSTGLIMAHIGKSTKRKTAIADEKSSCRSSKRIRRGSSDSDSGRGNTTGHADRPEGAFGRVSVKRKAYDDIGSIGAMKKMRRDEDSSDEE